MGFRITMRKKNSRIASDLGVCDSNRTSRLHPAIWATEGPAKTYIVRGTRGPMQLKPGGCDRQLDN